MLSSVYKWRLFFIASHPVFAVNNKHTNTSLSTFRNFTLINPVPVKLKTDAKHSPEINQKSRPIAS